ncbi:TetR/AcrR family transcriptional regulator [Pseudoclavibacter terrae]|uniref:TetR/AcrR family transcriptional regulator n=1 Tax=Pseudoclavibacter terrae TaxID=1530195 RepID=A0A7J5B0B2_9MICO|nr:TetR/AcrR family transcriptional regulator [Pseudoclavibacter terrae]KAB1637269.1 TetR/AcrR family transcriptional regulator [Pseudoclavibacter terrae]
MTSTRTRLSATARKAQIVSEADILIRERGFQALSIAAVAEACGVSRMGVLHHVGSKENLLIEVLEAKERETTVEVAALLGDTGEQDARRVLDVMMNRNMRHREVIHLFTVLAAESINPEHPAHAYFAERLQRGARLLAPLFVEYSDEPELTALEVLSFMDGLQLNWLRDPTIDIAARWDDFLSRYLIPTRERALPAQS